MRTEVGGHLKTISALLLSFLLGNLKSLVIIIGGSSTLHCYFHVFGPLKWQNRFQSHSSVALNKTCSLNGFQKQNADNSNIDVLVGGWRPRQRCEGGDV